MEILPVGSVLRARTPSPNDPLNVVRVVGLHDVAGSREIVVAPAFEFGPNLSATADSLLREYALLTDAETAALETE